MTQYATRYNKGVARGGGGGLGVLSPPPKMLGQKNFFFPIKKNKS